VPLNITVHGVRHTAREIGVATNAVLTELRSYASRVLTGAAIPAPAPVITPPTTGAMTPVFCLENVRWRDDDGMKTATRYATCTMPEATAVRAFEHNLGCGPASERAARLRQTYGDSWGPVEASQCVDLAESALRPGDGPAPVLHSGFERREGPTRQISIPGPTI
jgi:hypothetical protein